MENKDSNPFFISARNIFSILFASSKPVAISNIKTTLALNDHDLKMSLSLLEGLLSNYTPLFIQEADDHLILKTRPEFSDYIKLALGYKGSVRLSDESYITLSLIAYKQPIKKSSIDEIRGIDSEKTLDTLKKLGLIKTIGSTSGPGSPLLYVTTREFLLRLNLKSLSDLPEI